MKNQLLREKTGLKELDGLLQGGFPKRSIVGIRGPAGVGKSIFALHFLLEGARNKKKSVYINLDEPRSNIDNMVRCMRFTKDFANLEKKSLLKVICLSYDDYEAVFKDLLNKIRKDKKISRLVIDSFNGFFTYASSIEEGFSTPNKRKMLNASLSIFREVNITTIVTLEKEKGRLNDINFLINFMADGIIDLDYISLGSIERRIFIPKMRWTNQFDSSLPFEITSGGIQIHAQG